MINKVLYLGPTGSYSEIAKDKFTRFYSENYKSEYYNSISQIIRILSDSKTDSIAGVIPIENSIEGVVRETQDGLIHLASKNIRILAETHLKIEHCLISYGDKSKIQSISSHPQALAQCREYIYNNWKDDISLIPVLSTSAAVKSLQKNTPKIAAIASEYCAKTYNIPVIESAINDEKNNTTRFILLAKTKPQKESSNKISIVFSTENVSGALSKVLNIFEKYNLNMSYIDSRPSRKELGEYIFYVDFAGYIEDGNVNSALIAIQPFVKMFSVLSEGAICV